MSPDPLRPPDTDEEPWDPPQDLTDGSKHAASVWLIATAAVLVAFVIVTGLYHYGRTHQ